MMVHATIRMMIHATIDALFTRRPANLTCA